MWTSESLPTDPQEVHGLHAKSFVSGAFDVHLCLLSKPGLSLVWGWQDTTLADFIHVFLVLSLVISVTATADDVFMSKTADPRIVVNGLNVLVPMSTLTAFLIDDLTFFVITSPTVSNAVLAYVMFRRGNEVDWIHTTSRTVLVVGAQRRSFDWRPGLFIVVNVSRMVLLYKLSFSFWKSRYISRLTFSWAAFTTVFQALWSVVWQLARPVSFWCHCVVYAAADDNDGDWICKNMQHGPCFGHEQHLEILFWVVCKLWPGLWSYQSLITVKILPYQRSAAFVAVWHCMRFITYWLTGNLNQCRKQCVFVKWSACAGGWHMYQGALCSA